MTTAPALAGTLFMPATCTVRTAPGPMGPPFCRVSRIRVGGNAEKGAPIGVPGGTPVPLTVNELLPEPAALATLSVTLPSVVVVADGVNVVFRTAVAPGCNVTGSTWSANPLGASPSDTVASTKPSFLIVMGAGALVEPTCTSPRSAGFGVALIVGASSAP